MRFNSICEYLTILIAIVSAKNLPLSTNGKIATSQNGNLIVAPLYLIHENYYVTNISVGTPPQPFIVGFCSAMDITFIPSIYCSSCNATHFFDYTKSNTTIRTEVHFTSHMDNNVKTYLQGLKSYETFHLAGLEILEQMFDDVNEEKNYYFPVDGMISLRYASDCFVMNMYSRGLIPQPLLAYYISNETGEVSFGEPNPARYSGDISYYDNDENYGWGVKLDNITINDTGVLPKYMEFWAIFDPVVVNIRTGPKNLKKINQAIGATLQNDGSYTIDCDTLDQRPPFSFIMNGRAFTLEPREYTYVRNNQCVSYFGKSNHYGDQYFNVGIPFFKKFYTIFDYANKRVGLADAK